MNKIKRMVTAWVLMMSSIALLGAAGYIAHADAGGDTWFGGSGDSMGNAPRERRPAGNRPWGGNVAEGGEGEVKEQPKPIPEGESVWEDVPEERLTNKERLKSRPGNYGVLVTLFDFIEGTHAVEPELRGLCFPFWQEVTSVKQSEGKAPEKTVKTTVLESQDEAEVMFRDIEDRARKRGRKEQNGGRKSNLFVEKMEVRDFAPDEAEFSDAEAFGMNARQIETFDAVRKQHSEQCCVVMLSIRSERLVSESKDTKDLFFCLVRKAEGWRICWFSEKE